MSVAEQMAARAVSPDASAGRREAAVSRLEALPPDERKLAINKLMGLAVHGEKVAARTYTLIGKLKPEFDPLMRKFAHMEGMHSTWFNDISRENDIQPDKDFADGELGYLISQVEDHYKAGDADALAVVQGFIVESLAIATYDPFLSIADQYPGSHEIFKKVLDEEHYHVDWVTRYLRLTFFDREAELMTLANRVNVKGIDCIGGTMMKIADSLTTIGMSGADCAGAMMDGYTELLETVGVNERDATRNVVSMFMPLMRKYRHGEKIK
jgi:rubrerythrin